MLLAVVLTVGILPATAHAAEDDNLIDLHIDGTQDYDEINEVLEYVNQYRAEVGAEPVVLDAELTKYAMEGSVAPGLFIGAPIVLCSVRTLGKQHRRIVSV